MRAFIYSGGEIFPQFITECPEDDDIIIAADSGYKNAKRLGVTPKILIGDFDSLKARPDDVDEIIDLPCEKDVTDTQYAVDVALKRGANEIYIICGTGGRFDHAISNMCLLEGLYKKGVRGVIVSGQNRIRYIKDTGIIIIRDKNYKYFSVLAADEKVKGVSIEGGKYPLSKKTLTRVDQFAVSNEIEKNAALITVKKGGIYIVESRDMT